MFMLGVFGLHVLFFSGLALMLTALPRPYRYIYFYCYLTALLIVGGFLGNAYSLPISDGILVSGGNLAYGAFMMSSILLVLAERDIFILPRIMQLLIFVNVFKIVMMKIVALSIDAPGALNPTDTPSALFQHSIPFILLGGVLIFLELAVLLFVFEKIKRAARSLITVQIAYLLTFIAILCLDGIVFPLFVFGISPDIIDIVAGSFSGKLLTATSYSLAIIVFTTVFPKRFAAYLNATVFCWQTLKTSSSQIIRDLEAKDAQITKSQSRIAHSARLAGLGYAISDLGTGQVVECDAAYAAMHRMTPQEFEQMKISDLISNLVHEEDRDTARETLAKVRNGNTGIDELRHTLPSGEIRYLRKIFTPVDPSDPNNTLYEVVGQDVTESKQLQDRLFQSQKMDAIGKLTGGVAHDFNNLLAVTLGNLELLDDEISDPDQKDLIRNGIDATMRGADLTRSMLSFARKAPLQPIVTDINQLVQDAEKWICRTLPSNITVNCVLADGLSPIRVDPTSAESGLLNLILNARDAMPTGGTLTITTSATYLGAETPNHRDDDDAGPGPYILLTVGDTGEGISPRHLANIFDPFFTTKMVGKGSGLGLAMLDGFMRQSGGTIRVRSEPDVGTTFGLYFPIAIDSPKTVDPIPEPAADPTGEPNATILVAEDNVDVLAALRSALVKTRYRVLEATTGDEAFAVFKSNPGIDLLLTDVVMPGTLQGPALALASQELRPDLPVIFITGNAGEDPVGGADDKKQNTCLVKPVHREDLLKAIRTALSSVD